MDDRHVEAVLKRYRPAAPPGSLRERCLTPLPATRVWPWAAAAAALLIVTVGLRVAAATATAGANVAPAPEVSANAVAELAETLGGDAFARRQAEQIIDGQLRRDHERAERAMPPAGEFQ